MDVEPSKKKVSLIVPFYNEGEAVGVFHRALSAALDGMAEVDFEVVCIDDGSRDNTLAQLLAISALDPRFKLLELSRNFGKEAAMSAGLDYATGDAVIPIDADLQDPPEVIPQLIAKWREGFDVVCAQRISRETDTYMKRTTAEMFYRLHNKVASMPLPENVGDFRLMDRKVVDALKAMPERQRFMKGLFAWVGFKTAVIGYERQAREAGSSKFSGWKLWNFALEGLTSFSTVPLRVWTYAGLTCALLTLFYAIYITVRTMLFGIVVPGYASLLVAILFFGSVQLISVGVLGEYIGRIYIETKQRPLYIVRRLYVAGEAST